MLPSISIDEMPQLHVGEDQRMKDDLGQLQRHYSLILPDKISVGDSQLQYNNSTSLRRPRRARSKKSGMGFERGNPEDDVVS